MCRTNSKNKGEDISSLLTWMENNTCSKEQTIKYSVYASLLSLVASKLQKFLLTALWKDQ